MGHTNYWKRDFELPANALAAAVKDCKKIVERLNIPLGGRDGTGKPIFRADLIAFNGKAPGEYETFVIERMVSDHVDEPKVFEFCKTNQLPYDLAVQVALIVLKHHLGQAIVISSDGNEPDWDQARKACQKWLGYGEKFRLEK